MGEERYDIIIVGAGQAGPPLAARCSREGLRTLLIERGAFGGTCVNDGCIPSKALVASARAIHQARRGDEFGFSTEGLAVDMGRIRARKEAIVRESREGVEQWVRGLENCEVREGEARFVAPRVLEVGGSKVTAPRIFLNVGARAAMPSIPGLDQVPVLDNASVMALAEVPEHLLIVGGSYIGLEFAQMMRRFGARVTVIERADRLLSREDEDVSDCIRDILEAEGIRFELGAECTSLAREAGRVVARADCEGEPSRRVVGSHVLMAVGRTPNTDRLDLEAAGIETDERGYIRVDDQCRTSAEGVWALGECNGHGAFTHTAYNDYEIVAANLFDDDPRRISERITCYALYIDPPLGRAGMTEAEARESGRKVLCGRLPMSRVGRARETSETRGFMKVLVDAEDRTLLGAAILGRNGDEVIHTLLDVMAAGQLYTTISRTVHIHPTVSELLPTLLQGLEPLE